MRAIAALGLLLTISAAASAGRGEQSTSRPPAKGKKLTDYKVIVVKAFTIDKNAQADTPEGLESALHARAVQKLQAKALFDAVVDAAPAAANEAAAPNARLDLRVGAAQPSARGIAEASGRDDDARAARHLILNCTVLSFSKGNRAARYVAGFGAGQSKLKVRFSLADAKSGAEVMSWEQTGTFKGTFKPFGGSGNSAFNGAANGVMRGLIKQIETNR